MSTTTPSVVVEEVVEGKKKGRNPFWPLFSPFGSSHHLHLSLSLPSLWISSQCRLSPKMPNPSYTPPILCVSSLFVPPEYTKDIHAQARPFRSEHSSSRAQNAPLSPPPCGSVGPFPMVVCCYKVLLLLLPAFPGVCVACVLCSRRPHRNAEKKKRTKEENIMRRNEVEAGRHTTGRPR